MLHDTSNSALIAPLSGAEVALLQSPALLTLGTDAGACRPSRGAAWNLTCPERPTKLIRAGPEEHLFAFHRY